MPGNNRTRRYTNQELNTYAITNARFGLYLENLHHTHPKTYCYRHCCQVIGTCSACRNMGMDPVMSPKHPDTVFYYVVPPGGPREIEPDEVLIWDSARQDEIDKLKRDLEQARALSKRGRLDGYMEVAP